MRRSNAHRTYLKEKRPCPRGETKSFDTTETAMIGSTTATVNLSVPSGLPFLRRNAGTPKNAQTNGTPDPGCQKGIAENARTNGILRFRHEKVPTLTPATHPATHLLRSLHTYGRFTHVRARAPDFSA